MASAVENRLVRILPRVIEMFQQSEGSIGGIAQRCIVDSRQHFLGIHHKSQTGSFEELNDRFSKFKAELLRIMEVGSNGKIVQVIGISEKYSPEGTRRCLALLNEIAKTNAVFLYGYTGHMGSDGTRCVNAAVSDVIELNGLQDRSVANLVGYHSLKALNEWGCTGPELKYHIVVYKDDESSKETGTLFGDDIVTSDYITDEFVLLEGGIQSFSQTCNALIQEKPVIALDNLKAGKSLGLTVDGQFKPYFSAVGFLKGIKEKVDSANENEIEVTDELLDQWMEEYFNDHLIANPEKQDYSTKQSLFDSAWALFRSGKLYKKLELIKFQ